MYNEADRVLEEVELGAALPLPLAHVEVAVRALDLAGAEPALGFELGELGASRAAR